MKASIVLGGNFGDECKGSFVNNLITKEKSLVIRFNGGHQAGHTVFHNNIRHTFSSFGSGTLQNTPTFWSKFCTVYPPAMLNEYKILKNLGIIPEIYIDPLAPITTPYDTLANINEDIDNKHGTVGVGFGTTIKRHESFYKLYYQDLFNKTILEAKMANIKKYYTKLFGYAFIYDINIQLWYNSIDELIKENILSIHKMGFDKIPKNHKQIIFEGAQGILLDMDFGFFPNVTRSNTTSKNVFTLIKELNLQIDYMDTYYISRCYQTRHGYGFMSNENLNKPELINIENEINKNCGYQGIFRKTFLDLNLLKYSIDCDSHFNKYTKKHIVITCLDQLKNSEITYTTDKDFRLFSKNFNDFSIDLENITGIKNIIKGISEGIFKQHI